MHPTTTIATRRGGTRLAVFGVLLALALLGIAQLAASALAASTPFNGGPVTADCPTVIANDHTVYALRFQALAGGDNPLDASTTYYVKIRLTPNADGTPAGVDNRGFTWNATSGEWAQEREDWTSFPTITTAADGSITPSNSNWLYFAFGDTAKTGAYQLLVSLSEGVAGGTRNCDTPVSVQVIDPSTDGFWVHDGVDNSSNAGKRPDVVAHADAGDSNAAPLALQRAELNLCDDDHNGVVDDERYGPVQLGGFRMAAPLNEAVDVRMQKASWNSGTDGITGTTADVDIAVGAGDTTPPSAPGALTVTRDTTTADLSWGAATDDTGVTGYRIYRWTDAPSGAGYTMPIVKIDEVDGSTTTYQDTGLDAGTMYYYIVRAVDAATNLGPRSPKAEGTLSLDSTATVIKRGGNATLTGALTDGGQPLHDDQQVALQRSYNKHSWAVLATLDPSTGLAYQRDVQPARTTYYRLVFAGDPSHMAITSHVVKVAPQVKLGRPVAPKRVKKGVRFTAYGSLAPRHAAGKSYVKVRCYLRHHGKWVLKRTFKGRDSNYHSITRYKARCALPTRGSWKLVATYAATSKYAATRSGARYVRVR